MHGSGTSESARETMERNRGAFVDRWGERLARRPRVVQAASEPGQMLAARDSEALERILVIDDRVPFADRGSGDPRMARMLGELAALWPSARVTLLAATGLEAERYAEPLLQQGIEIVCPPVDFNQWFRERRFHYGLAIVSRHTNMLRFGGFLNQTQPQALTVFDSEALTFHRLERQAEVLPPGERRNDVRIQAAKARNSEIHAVQHADVVFVVTNEEAEFVAEVAPGKPTFVLPSFVETLADPPGFDERSDVIFFGGFLGGAASPNEDALAFLVHEVMPLFWERHPSVGLTVIGADMSDSRRALESPRVRIVGYVEDPSGWLSRARLHVNPMRFGSGLKLKFLDPPAGGLALGELRQSLVAGGPIALAERRSALYTDSEEWERAQAYLLDLGETRFDRASGWWRAEAPAPPERVSAADAAGVVGPQGAQAADVRGLPRGRIHREARPADCAGREPPRALGRRLDQASGRSGALLVPARRALSGLPLARLGRPVADEAPLLRRAAGPDGPARARHRLRRGLLLL